MIKLYFKKTKPARMENSWLDFNSFSTLVSKNSSLWWRMSLENSEQKVSQVHQSSIYAICESKYCKAFS